MTFQMEAMDMVVAIAKRDWIGRRGGCLGTLLS